MITVAFAGKKDCWPWLATVVLDQVILFRASACLRTHWLNLIRKCQDESWKHVYPRTKRELLSPLPQ